MKLLSKLILLIVFIFILTLPGKTRAEIEKDNSRTAYPEIISKRTYNQKVYALDDNHKRYKVHAGHIHYKENGEFKDIDLHLRETDGGWVMDKSNYHIFIPEYADGEFDFYNAYEGADHHVKERPIANHVKGELNYDEKYVIYKNAFGEGIHFKPLIEKFGFRKLIQVDKKPDKDLVFDFEIITDENTQYLKLGLDGDEELKIGDEVIDLTGKTFRFGKDKYTYIKEAEVWDSSDSPKREDVKLELFRKNDKLILRKIIPKEYFNAAALPVYTNNPDIYYDDTSDGVIHNQNQPTWALAHDAETSCPGCVQDDMSSSLYGFDAAYMFFFGDNYTVRRSFFYFDTSGIDDSYTVTACDLNLFGRTYIVGPPDICAMKGTQADPLVAADFDAFTGSYYGKVTWVIDQYNTISFNSTGCSDVDKTGITKICCREYDHDYLNSEPSDGNTAGVYFTEDPGTNGDNRDPYLEITAAASGITLSGTIYTNEAKSANVGAGVDVSLSVNGAAKSTVQTTAGGAFSFSSVSTDSNETLTVFIDDDLNYEANLITQAASSDADITGLEVYTDKIILRHETAGPMTNALLAIADGSGDDDIHYSMTGNNADFDDNLELWIDNAKAYTPGGNIEADDLELSGTASLIPEANSVDAHGSFVISATGVFTKGTSTITLDGASDQLLTTNSQAFHNLIINNTGAPGSNDIVLNNDLDVDGKLTITDGNLDCSVNNPGLFISGDFEIGADGAFTKGSGATTFNGTTTFRDNTTPKQNLGTVVVD